MTQIQSYYFDLFQTLDREKLANEAVGDNAVPQAVPRQVYEPGRASGSGPGNQPGPIPPPHVPAAARPWAYFVWCFVLFSFGVLLVV